MEALSLLSMYPTAYFDGCTARLTLSPATPVESAPIAVNVPTATSLFLNNLYTNITTTTSAVVVCVKSISTGPAATLTV